MSSIARAANVGLDLTGRVAVISGGTQGIGAATALRFAAAGASVYVIGRNERLGQEVVQQLKEAGSEIGGRQRFEFIKADLSLMSDVKRVALDIKNKSGTHGVDFLVQTQGGPPRGILDMTPEGHEFRFCVQILSRFVLALLLAKSGTLKQSFVSVCAPNGPNGNPPDLEDLELLKLRASGKGRLGILGAEVNRDGDVMDGIVAHFTREYPHLKAYHVTPGIVTSKAAQNSRIPYPVVLFLRIFGPLIERTFGNSPTSYAEIPVYLAANPHSEGKDLEFSNEKLKPHGKALWLDDEAKTSALWKKLEHLGGI
ncbi:protein of glucose/ribitol dehydrogenase family [Pseudohyphozyma bogoriensis]|nr:protein of glucose/ribitol dehydrogenase family [Pseudohyphozyma bogoriensis]